jgi:phosphohistidine phosphatase
MNLYLMRHAHAVDQEQWMGPDAWRPLIEKGRQAAQAAALGLARAAPPITQIVSSPLTRALQTAQLVAAALSAPITQSDALGTMFDITRLPEILDSAGWASDTLLVGHQPSLGVVLAALTGKSLSETDLKKAAVALVTLDDAAAKERRLVKAGSLEWIRGWRDWENAGDA